MAWIVRNAALMCLVVISATIWDLIVFPGNSKALFMTWGFAYIIWSLECVLYFCTGVIRENYRLDI
ncbi:hypothetical protein [Neobacillus terrae]|uniref:hypothetical protein n=1 Tax=Neobacillus terrae TaxID=3034837 RepID=UPI0014077EC6|nr:hypothetical protein [Neobacillus terrae]NHM30046.1 hypothetical protein [Neobacillus terrae]